MKQKSTPYDYVFSIAFVVLITAFMLLFFVLPNKEKDLLENRMLAQKPALDFKHLDDLPPAFNSYFNDQFPFRAQFIHWYNRFQISFYHKAAGDNVIVGKSGWFYFKTRELEAYQGKTLYSKDELSKIHEELLLRKNRVESEGGKFYFVIVPTKYTVYPEFLSAKYSRRSALNKREQLFDFLLNAGDISVIDLSDTLISNKKKGKLFYKTDNHWTALGAFIGTRAIVSYLRRDFPALQLPLLSDYEQYTQTQIGGNLVAMLGLHEEYLEEVLHIDPRDSAYSRGVKRNYPVIEGFAYPWDYEQVFVAPQAPKIKMLMIRESFATAQEPFLSPVFGESVVIFDAWRHGRNTEIVQKEKAAVVILQVLECFLDNLLDEEK